jgi:hypothetical protein
LKNPYCTIRIFSGGYSPASANASSADPRNQMSNSSSCVSKTGQAIERWLA